MALIPELQFPGKIIPGNINYPQGEARNVTEDNDGTGTPWISPFINDVFGLQQAIIRESNIAPSNTPDTAISSQYLSGIKNICAKSHTIDELRLVDPSIDRQVYNDIDGGEWYFDESDSDTEDDGTLTLVAVNNKRIKRLPRESLNYRRPKQINYKLYSTLSENRVLNFVQMGDSLAHRKNGCWLDALDRKFGGTSRTAENLTAGNGSDGSVGDDLEILSLVNAVEEVDQFEYFFTGLITNFSDNGEATLTRNGVNPEYTSLKVYYIVEPGAGSISIEVDGVIEETASADGVFGLGILEHIDDETRDPIKIKVSGGNVRVVFAHTIYGESGVNFYKAFSTGGLLLDDSVGGNGALITAQILADIEPDLITFEMADDLSIETGRAAFSAWTSQTQSVAPLADKLIYTSAPTLNNPEIKEYNDSYLKRYVLTLDKSWLLFDGFTMFDSYQDMVDQFGADDGVHPNPQVSNFLANLVWDFLGLPSDVMGYGTRAINDPSTPSIFAEGSRFVGTGNRSLEFTGTGLHLDWEVGAERSIALTDQDGLILLRVSNNTDSRSNIMPESWSFAEDGGSRSFSIDNAGGIQKGVFMDTDNEADAMVLRGLWQPSQMTRAELLAGYAANQLRGALVRVTDGNQGDGVYMAVGTSAADWRLVTAAGTV